MKLIALVMSVAATIACAPHREEPASHPLSVPDVAGHYGQAGQIGYLTLAPDGEYECLILNGVTIDGCGTFAGSGLSRGVWAIEGEAVSFTPTAEPTDLAVKLATAAARTSAGGLVLTVEGREHHLAREVAVEVQPDPPLQPGADAPSTHQQTR